MRIKDQYFSLGPGWAGSLNRGGDEIRLLGFLGFYSDVLECFYLGSSGLGDRLIDSSFPLLSFDSFVGHGLGFGLGLEKKIGETSSDSGRWGEGE